MESLAQPAFLDRLQFLQRTVGAPIVDNRPGFQAVHARRLEQECEQQFGAREEQSGPPETLAERKTPFRRRRLGELAPDLNQPDGRIVAGGNNPEADLATAVLLVLRPLDEALEPLHAIGRRQDELSDRLGGQQREERFGITGEETPQRDARRLQRP